MPGTQPPGTKQKPPVTKPPGTPVTKKPGTPGTKQEQEQDPITLLLNFVDTLVPTLEEYQIGDFQCPTAYSNKSEKTVFMSYYNSKENIADSDNYQNPLDQPKQQEQPTQPKQQKLRTALSLWDNYHFYVTHINNLFPKSKTDESTTGPATTKYIRMLMDEKLCYVGTVIKEKTRVVGMLVNRVMLQAVQELCSLRDVYATLQTNNVVTAADFTDNGIDTFELVVDEVVESVRCWYDGYDAKGERQCDLKTYIRQVNKRYNSYVESSKTKDFKEFNDFKGFKYSRKPYITKVTSKLLSSFYKGQTTELKNSTLTTNSEITRDVVKSKQFYYILHRVNRALMHIEMLQLYIKDLLKNFTITLTNKFVALYPLFDDKTGAIKGLTPKQNTRLKKSRYGIWSLVKGKLIESDKTLTGFDTPVSVPSQKDWTADYKKVYGGMEFTKAKEVDPDLVLLKIHIHNVEPKLIEIEGEFGELMSFIGTNFAAQFFANMFGVFEKVFAIINDETQLLKVKETELVNIVKLMSKELKERIKNLSVALAKKYGTVTTANQQNRNLTMHGGLGRMGGWFPDVLKNIVATLGNTVVMILDNAEKLKEWALATTVGTLRMVTEVRPKWKFLVTTYMFARAVIDTAGAIFVPGLQDGFRSGPTYFLLGIISMLPLKHQVWVIQKVCAGVTTSSVIVMIIQYGSYRSLHEDLLNMVRYMIGADLSSKESKAFMKEYYNVADEDNEQPRMTKSKENSFFDKLTGNMDAGITKTFKELQGTEKFTSKLSDDDYSVTNAFAFQQKLLDLLSNHASSKHASSKHASSKHASSKHAMQDQDAGAYDAGVNDAGVNDAGVSDAGVNSEFADEEDANTTYKRFLYFKRNTPTSAQDLADAIELMSGEGMMLKYLPDFNTIQLHECMNKLHEVKDNDIKHIIMRSILEWFNDSVDITEILGLSKDNANDHVKRLHITILGLREKHREIIKSTKEIDFMNWMTTTDTTNTEPVQETIKNDIKTDVETLRKVLATNSGDPNNQNRLKFQNLEEKANRLHKLCERPLEHEIIINKAVRDIVKKQCDFNMNDGSKPIDVLKEMFKLKTKSDASTNSIKSIIVEFIKNPGLLERFTSHTVKNHMLMFFMILLGDIRNMIENNMTYRTVHNQGVGKMGFKSPIEQVLIKCKDEINGNMGKHMKQIRTKYDQYYYDFKNKPKCKISDVKCLLSRGKKTIWKGINDVHNITFSAVYGVMMVATRQVKTPKAVTTMENMIQIEDVRDMRYWSSFTNPNSNFENAMENQMLVPPTVHDQYTKIAELDKILDRDRRKFIAICILGEKSAGYDLFHDWMMYPLLPLQDRLGEEFRWVDEFFQRPAEFQFSIELKRSIHNLRKFSEPLPWSMHLRNIIISRMIGHIKTNMKIQNSSGSESTELYIEAVKAVRALDRKLRGDTRSSLYTISSKYINDKMLESVLATDSKISESDDAPKVKELLRVYRVDELHQEIAKLRKVFT
jgi:hypothetical protein